MPVTFFQAQQSAISVLLKRGQSLLLPDIIDKCLNVFENPQLRLVTNEDYNIMLTPEGEVYDKSILER